MTEPINLSTRLPGSCCALVFISGIFVFQRSRNGGPYPVLVRDRGQQQRRRTTGGRLHKNVRRPNTEGNERTGSDGHVRRVRPGVPTELAQGQIHRRQQR